jgi:hypothetical protein
MHRLWFCFSSGTLVAQGCCDTDYGPTDQIDDTGMEQEPADREFIAHLVSTAVEDLAAKNDHKDIPIK